MSFEALHKLLETIPRAGPGRGDSTLEALRRLPALPPSPRVIDLGCGKGGQTLALAEALRTKIIAVDIHEPSLAVLRREATERGLGHLVEAKRADMGSLDYPAGSFDLVWSGGAIFFLGFAGGLRRWRPLLKPGGLMAVSDACWIKDERPPDIVEYYAREYPGMCTIAECRAAAAREGFKLLDHFVMPQSVWWEGYYTWTAERIEALRGDAGAHIQALIAEIEREMDINRRYGDSYGYVFFLLRANRA